MADEEKTQSTKAEDYTSRKFLLCLLATAQVSVGFWLGKVTAAEWMVFLGATFLGYGVLNIFSSLLSGPTKKGA